MAVMSFMLVMFAAPASGFCHGVEPFRGEASWDPLYRAPESATHRAVTGGPSTSIALNAARLRPGQQLAIGISAQNPSGNAPADLFVGMLLPDGRTLVLFSASGTPILGSLSALNALVPTQTIPPNTGVSARAFGTMSGSARASCTRETAPIGSRMLQARATNQSPAADLVSSTSSEISASRPG